MLTTFFKSRRTPELDLNEFVESLQSALKARLKSVMVFGSFASEDFHPEHSDVNVLVVADMTFDALEAIGPALRKWVKRGHTPPVLASPEDLPGMARSFPIEFLDMLDVHRVQFGSDPLVGLTVDNRHLRAQVEHDLALARLRLRQSIAAAERDPKTLRAVMVKSLPSVMTLFRAAVRLEENLPKIDKIQASERLASRAGFEISVIQRLQNLKIRRESDNIGDLAAHYLKVIDTALNYVRK